jgi:hypothetical protein
MELEDDYTDELLDELKLSIVDDIVIDNAGVETCCFKLDCDSENLPENIFSLSENIDYNAYIDCLVTTVSNINRAMLIVSKRFSDKNVRFAMADLFMRYRHEVLHNLSMLSLGLDVLKTDMQFSEVFGLESDRTPDRIIVIDNRVLVIETTAVMNVTKSYITKGKVEEGFESKYEREFRLLRDMGYHVDYVVLIFDMKNPTNNSFMVDLNTISDILEVNLSQDFVQKLSAVKNVFVNNSIEILKTYSNEVMLLLNLQVKCENKLKDNILYNLVLGKSQMGTYSRTHVSSHIYNKLSRSWEILPHLLNKLKLKDSSKVLLYFDYMKNNFYFSPSSEGISFDLMMDSLIMGDKGTVIKALRRVVSGSKIPSERADIEFFDIVKSKPVDAVYFEYDQVEHANTRYWQNSAEILDYSDRVNQQYYTERRYYNEDPDYENKLVEDIGEMYDKIETINDLKGFSENLKKLPFGSNIVDSDMIKRAVESYKKSMETSNGGDTEKVYIRYQKQPFIYPLMDCQKVEKISFKQPPKDALHALGALPKGGYTTVVYNEIVKENFVWGSRPKNFNDAQLSALKELADLNRVIYKKQKELKTELNLKRLPKLSEHPHLLQYKTEVSNLNKKVKKVGASQNREISMIRIPLKSKNKFREMFNAEMEHYRKKSQKASYKGIGVIDFNNCKNTYNTLKLLMKTPGGPEPKDNILSELVSEDANLLKMLKTDYTNNLKVKLDLIKGTLLYSACEFVSRLCHSLAYLSQTSFNGDIVTVDNLGYDNVILMVKGGKKVFRTKKSKLYRLLHPVSECLENWYNDPNFTNSSEFVRFNGNLYILTPWQSMNETLLNDGLTFLHRTMSYVLLCHEPEPLVSVEKCFFNIMLSFHARRKTEEMLHNLRYISVNCISNVSKIDDMLPTLAGFNYDSFQSYIRSSIEENFEKYANTLINYNNEPKASSHYFKELGFKSLIGESDIDSLEDLTLTIYSTFLMSKSPTTQSLEQTANLKNMLETHISHKKESVDNPQEKDAKNGNSLRGFDCEWNRLFESDFNYDDKYCHLLGSFTADYLNNITDSGELQSEWIKIVETGWDEFANTKGLRGYNNENFFNKKGYFVVYSQILEDSEFLEKVKDLIQSDEDHFTKRKNMAKLNKKYRDHVGCVKLEQIIMHVVDKKQRGGKREIFVMDIETKKCQQMIEKYIQFICKKIPNEAISIPSNKRLQHIHTTVFEKFKEDEGIDYNISFDCRKWAPRSIINKFIEFIIGMSKILPDSFVTHFLNFFALMYKKKIYTKDYIYEIMVKNNATKKLIEDTMVKCDKYDKGYYLEMSYSWIMGIFNYMSSLMHVMNQIHAGHIIYRITLDREVIPTIMHMNAHSDDSCGKLKSQSELSMRKAIIIYEFLLKKSNHLLSDKKCNVSLKYFEFLSVLYINNKLLSLLNKITGSFSFHPTDKGYCGDINEAYSRCIEILSVGGTFEQAYAAMKISSHSIFRFYFNRDPVAMDYKVPTQLLGMPDAHPLMVMITGSDSDIIRLTYKDDTKLNKFLRISNLLSSVEQTDLELLRPITVMPRITPPDVLKKQLDKIENFSGLNSADEDLKWILMNTKLRSTSLRLLRYGMQLKDKTFIASLIDETITRRISRAYHFRSSTSVSTPFGNVSYKEIKHCINMIELSQTDVELTENMENIIREVREKLKIEEIEDSSKNFNSMYQLLNLEIFEMMAEFDKLFYGKDDIEIYNKTCKPIHLNLQKTSLPTEGDFSPSNLTIWICFPNYRWLIPLGDDYKQKSEQLRSFLNRYNVDLDKMEPKWVYSFLERYKKRYIKEYFIYTNMPHNIRDVSNYRDMLSYLAHNSFKNRFIKGIVLPFGETVTQRLPVLFRDVFKKADVMTIEFLTFLSSIIINDNYRDVSEKLWYNGSPIGVDSGGIREVLSSLMDKYYKGGENSEFILPHLTSVMKLLDNEKITGEVLSNTYCYCFLKSQKSIGNVWLGVGKLFITMPNLNLELELLNQKVSKITSNKQMYTFNQQEVTYLNSVLLSAGLPKIESQLEVSEVSDWDKISLGFSTSGNITIDKVRNLLSYFKNFSSVRYIINPVTEIKKSTLKINSDLSYKFTSGDELLGQKTYTINTYKVDSSSVYDTMVKLLDNEKNILTLEKSGEVPGKFLRMLIGVSAGNTMRINMNNFLDFYKGSVTYKIVQKLVKTGVITSSITISRKHLYPGQHGGLLSALIDYKKADDNFQFFPEGVTSQEMMLLKSSQPEAFISNLTNNINDRFKALYTSEEKSIILSQIDTIWKATNSAEREGKFLSLLTTWGYVGVMGSVESIRIEKTADNIKQFRNYPKNNVYKNINYRCLKSFINAIIKTAQNNNYFHEKLEDNLLISTSNIDIKKVFISYIHSYMLNTGKGKRNDYTEINNFEINKIFNTLRKLFESESFIENLNENLESDPITSLIKIDSSSLKDIIIMFETIMSCIAEDLRDRKAIFDNKRQLSFENVIQPYLKTKNILEETECHFKMLRAYHQGVISREQRKQLIKHRVFKCKGKLYDVNIVEGDISEFSQPFNKNLWIPGTFSEEFFESDEYDDLKTELLSTEPDSENFEELIEENIKPSYNRKIRIFNEKGDLVLVDRLYFKFYTLFDLKVNLSLLNNIRPACGSLLIYTNLYLEEILESGSQCVALFNNNSQKWYNQSIIDPTCCFFYVIDEKPINKDLWEKVLGSKHVSKEVIINKNEVTPNRLTLELNGNLKNHDSYKTLEEKLEMLEVEDEEDSETETDEVIEEKEFEDKLDKEIERLRNEGFDEDFIAEVSKNLKVYHEKMDFNLGDLIDKYINGKKASEIMKTSIKEDIMNVITKLEDYNKALRIFEVADIFSSGRNTNSVHKNNSLKNFELRAEVNSLSPGLMDKILSGMLSISSNTKRDFRKHLRSMRKWANDTKEKGDNKNFLIDICYMIMNDAYTDQNNNDDWMFENLIQKTRDYIVEDDEYESDEGDEMAKKYLGPDAPGRLYYEF